jgi:hypothetical protein
LLSWLGIRIGRGLFGSVSEYGFEGGFAVAALVASPKSDEDEEKADRVERWRAGFSGLGPPLARAESGPIDSLVSE